MARQAARQVQIYGWDAFGHVTHAGVVSMTLVSPRTLRREQRRWEAWRGGYLADNPGDYPLRHVLPTVVVQGWPVGTPQAAVSVDIV